MFPFFSKKRECFSTLKVDNRKEKMLQKKKRRKWRRDDFDGDSAHVEVHTKHFLLNMRSGSSHGSLRDSGFFSLDLNGGKKPMHHDRDIDHPIGFPHFAEESPSLAMPPILPRNIPMRGSCALTHTIQRVQIRPNTFPKRFVPHLWHHACLCRRSLKTTTPPSPPFSESISIPTHCKGASTSRQ